MDEVHLKSFKTLDIDLWNNWSNDTDFSIYQTHLLPKNYGTDNNNYQIFIICFNSVKIGAIWIEMIDLLNKTAWIGLFIGDSNYWGKGIGTQSISQILDIAFREINLDYIWLNVRETNKRAIRCYEKIGFKTIRQCGPKHFGDGSFQYWFEMMISKKDYTPINYIN